MADIDINPKNVIVSIVKPTVVSVSGVVVSNRYIHSETTPTTTWTISHNLGVKFPNIIVEDDDGEIHLGRLIPIDNNVITVVFNYPLSGTAYLN